ncbi:glucose 1-dehydrogenase [Streptomyces sp. NPDC048483]|uniref:SDR family NAD(P)-dependent oxidoreductase n=1 Tax=Streptomyces sp. NPDC048483 TaxID=3154927 RepID=UPI003416B21F
MGRLAGRVMLITGAARGQGAAAARLFAAEGARLVLTDIREDELHCLATELGECAVAVGLDVRLPESWERAVAAAVERWGRLDGLVNNAGVALYKTLERTSHRDWSELMDTNLLGVFLGMRAVLPALRAAGGGTVVNVASVGGLSGIPGMAAYCASKAGVLGLTRAAALEWGPHGIRVNAVCPGHIDTAMTRLPFQDSGALARALPLRRVGTPEEMSRLALFLSCDDSSYCTGSEFVADGGRTAGTY